MRRFAALWLCLALVGQAQAGQRLDLMGAYEAPAGLAVNGAPLGGISGIDYDRKSGAWLMISDDRSDKAPARFYTARLNPGVNGVLVFDLERSTTLRRVDGSTFPSARDPVGERVDAEALRIDPLTGDLFWASEGDPSRGFGPSLRRMTREGVALGEIPLPPALGLDPSGASGVRPNLGTEGVSLAPDGRSLWASMEAPLIQDGPVASVREGAVARIVRLDRDGVLLAQYAYRLDPIQAAPAASKRADNGISEILAVDGHRLLVLERSGVENAEGRFIFHCRLYMIDTLEAGMSASGSPRPLEKHLLINFDRLAGVSPRNLEAMGWGEPLPAGGRTLVLASDDNFDPQERTQVLMFAFRER